MGLSVFADQLLIYITSREKKRAQQSKEHITSPVERDYTILQEPETARNTMPQRSSVRT